MAFNFGSFSSPAPAAKTDDSSNVHLAKIFAHPVNFNIWTFPALFRTLSVLRTFDPWHGVSQGAEVNHPTLYRPKLRLEISLQYCQQLFAFSFWRPASSLPGWIGGYLPENFFWLTLREAHSKGEMADCLTRPWLMHPPTSQFLTLCLVTQS